MTNDRANDQPWYNNFFMVVFVIGLPAFVVVACIAFVFFAVRIQDSTVRDDWYMDGKALYQDASKDQRAFDLDITGVLRFEGQMARFTLHYPAAENGTAPYPAALRVWVSHATDKNKDRDFVLTKEEQSNVYVGSAHLDALPSKYYLQISGGEGQDAWRLMQAQKLPAAAVTFAPLAAFAPAKP